MSNGLLAENALHQTVQPQSYNSTSVQQLFDQLLNSLGCLVDEGQQEQDNLSSSRILLDITLNGVQYQVIHLAGELEPGQIKLTHREEQIVRLVAQGLPNKAIAATLSISPWTVATHIRRVFGKLNVASRTEMVARILHSRRI